MFFMRTILYVNTDFNIRYAVGFVLIARVLLDILFWFIQSDFCFAYNSSNLLVLCYKSYAAISYICMTKIVLIIFCNILIYLRIIILLLFQNLIRSDS